VSRRRRHAAGTLAIVIAAPAIAAAAEPTAALIARWRVLDATDPQVAAVVRALAARGAPAAEPAAPAAVATAVPATEPPRRGAARVWPAAGAERLDSGPAAEGLRLRVPAAAAVRVPAAGRVVFADRIDGLGLVLITAHGDEYHSVLAGLGSVSVDVNSRVAAGEQIGRMAERGETGLELHLELRHHGRPVDPLPWLGVNSVGDGRS